VESKSGPPMRQGGQYCPDSIPVDKKEGVKKTGTAIHCYVVGKLQKINKKMNG